MRLLIFILVLPFYAFADTDEHTVRSVYTASEDYNARFAKEKAFKLALDQAYQIIANDLNLDFKSDKWKIIDSVLSYQIKNEKIYENKYSATFDIKFNISKLKKLANRSSHETNQKLRLIYEPVGDRDDFLNIAQNLSQMLGVDFILYKDADKLFHNDIVVTCIQNPSEKEYVFSLESEGRLINLTARDLKESYFALIKVLYSELMSPIKKDANYILISGVSGESSNPAVVQKFLKEYFWINNIKIIGYESEINPIYLINIAEKDDLFLSYVYNNNDYTLNDMRIFKQIFEKL
ncbi:MAG: hypothetical protein RLN62_01240 [Rickettsiales bacterium]